MALIATIMAWSRRMAFAILTLGAVVAASCGARAQSNDGPVSFYGIEFPAAFADGQRIGVRDYESTGPGLGFSVGYRHRGATSTLYVYDAGVTSVPEDIRAAVVMRQFEQAKNDLDHRFQAEGATVKSKGPFVITDASRRPRLACEGFEARRSDRDPLDTYLCVGVVNAKFFKVRTTMVQRRESEDEFRRFIGAWVAKLWKSGSRAHAIIASRNRAGSVTGNEQRSPLQTNAAADMPAVVAAEILSRAG